MQITYLVVIGIITYIFGAINKAYIKVMPDKYIPIQNVLIGIVSGLVCYGLGIIPNILVSIIACLMATTSAGGTYDLFNMNK